MSEGPGHLLSDTLQEYLDGTLDATTLSEVEAHLGECRRCAAELEGWTLLFHELDELPALGPLPGFRERVLSRAPVRSASGVLAVPRVRGLWDRIRALVAGGGRSASEHLSPERIQDLLEGALTGRRRRETRAHMATCDPCRAEVGSWQVLFGTLEELPALEPSPGFAERVMAAVDPKRVPAPVAAWRRLPAEALATARRLMPSPRRLLPSTRKGWALAGGAVAAPAVGVMAIVGAVMAHPLLSVGDLAAFIWWRAGDLAGLAGGWVLGRVVDSPLLGQGWGLLELIASSPGVALGGLLALWAVTLGAAWILYRNVIQPFFVVDTHVR